MAANQSTPHPPRRAQWSDRRSALRWSWREDLWAATEGGDERIPSGGSVSPCGGARTPVERTESSGIRTSGRNMTIALKGCVERIVGFQPPGASMALDHPARTAIADHDASRSSAAHDIAGPARHGLHGPYSWFGSAGLPRVAFLPGLLGHSLRCSKFGRDRNSDRSTPVHGTEHTKTTGHALRRRVLARDEVNRACKNAAPTFLPTPVAIPRSTVAPVRPPERRCNGHLPHSQLDWV